MKWTYHRIKTGTTSASKWVSGKHWVTKFDDQRFCVIGYCGQRLEGINIFTPKGAREYIESRVKKLPF